MSERNQFHYLYCISLAQVHIIRSNGTHAEVVVGDELTDKHASYSRTFPPDTWLAIEIDGHGDGSYAFFTTVLVPGTVPYIWIVSLFREVRSKVPAI